MDKLELCLFSDLSGCDKIRGYQDEHGLNRWSVYDFINVICKKSNKNDYGRITFKRTCEKYPELEKLTTRTDCSGKLSSEKQIQRDTKAMTLHGLQRLFVLMADKVAEEYREMLTNTFARVMAGDLTLIKVIQANAESTAPLQEAFRESLEHEPADDKLEQLSGMKRKCAALEYDRQKMVSFTAANDHFYKMKHNGVISEAEKNMFLRSALFMHFPKTAASELEHIPSIDTLFIFWSAVVNFILQDISAKQVYAHLPCIDVAVSYAEMQNAVKEFFTPYVGYLVTETATQSIIDASLVPNPAHEPHEVRLQQLMRVQRNREMTIYSPCEFRNKSMELFKYVVTAKKSFFRISVQGLKHHLINQIPFQATGYDNIVTLTQMEPMEYRVTG